MVENGWIISCDKPGCDKKYSGAADQDQVVDEAVTKGWGRSEEGTLCPTHMGTEVT